MPLEVKSLAEWAREGIADMLSIVIPPHSEEGHIADTVKGVAAALDAAGIRCEILVVNDYSVDRTETIVRALGRNNPAVRASTTTHRTASALPCDGASPISGAMS